MREKKTPPSSRRHEHFQVNSSMKHKIVVSVLTVLILISTSVVLINRALSAPGDLDTTFNGTGSARVGFGQGDDEATSIAAQSDGKLVVVGGSSGSGTAFEVMRYNTDGSLDTSFGAAGVGKARLQPVSFGGVARAVKIQTDNKIVIAGTFFTGGAGTERSFGVGRLNADGSFDQTFGQLGRVTTQIRSTNDEALGLALQSDGKIVVVGFSALTSTTAFAVARYNTNGSLDTSFNGTGKVTTQIGSSHDLAFSVVVQGDGKILVAGSSFSGTQRDFLIVRYRADGVLDNSWGGTGAVITDFGGPTSDDSISAIAIQPGTSTVADTV